ncbi:glycosyl transferase family 2 [Motilibacter rhizosphaerae]|uniref:Glycosyl transferase family 2 n=2 Tax=Motilibacter rhizosphaerae TaxID=598652 RepID=A0A4Q7NQ29_9ACTN|nr:glycosyl transferase family 2 [Motilibacter rhizosphaerae]
MPTYLRMDYIREAVESALAQTLGEFELLVSDNASSPATRELLESYADPRIRYRTNAEGNVGATRNALNAYQDARAALLTTLHDDDVYEPTFLERLVPPLEADPTLSVAFSDHWLIDEKGVVDPEGTEENSRAWGRSSLSEGVLRPFLRQAVLERAVPVAMSTVFRSSAVDWSDFPEEVGTNYDLWIGYLAARDGSGAWFTPERLTRYRYHGQSITSGARYDRALSYCYDRFLADPATADLRPELEREARHWRTGLGITLLREGDRAGARSVLGPVLRGGASPRALAAYALAAAPFPTGRALALAQRVRGQSGTRG